MVTSVSYWSLYIDIYRYCSPIRDSSAVVVALLCGCAAVRPARSRRRPLPLPPTMRPPIAALLTPPTNQPPPPPPPPPTEGLYLPRSVARVGISRHFIERRLRLHTSVRRCSLVALRLRVSESNARGHRSACTNGRLRARGWKTEAPRHNSPFRHPEPAPGRNSTLTLSCAQRMLTARFVDDVAVRAQRIAREVTKDGACAVVSGIVMASLTSLSRTPFLPGICPMTLLGCYAPPLCRWVVSLPLEGGTTQSISDLSVRWPAALAFC